jgi:DNA-binding NarL/FixJ family response regulator
MGGKYFTDKGTGGPVTDTSSRQNLTLRAHVRLQVGLDVSRGDWADAGIFFEFTDPAALFATPSDDTPALVPAASEPDREIVRSLRRSRCLTTILAVVNDINGHQTFLAIKSGASGVLNVRLPRDIQIDAVLSACTGTAQLLPRAPRLHLAGGADVAPEPDPRLSDPEETGRLMQMLCGRSSISSIAQQFYCSERSMYRRIRRLYQHMGVSGRAELRSRMAGCPAVAASGRQTWCVDPSANPAFVARR